MIVVGCLLLAFIPLSVFWLSENVDLFGAEKGNIKRSDLFFDLLILVYVLQMLSVYYEEFIPAFSA